MDPRTVMWLDAVSDFVIAAGGTLSGGLLEQASGAHLPGPGTWLLAGVLGAVAAFKQVKARLAPSAAAR